MKEAFKFLERVALEPEQDQDGVATVTLSEAQWACKMAVREELNNLLGLLDEEISKRIIQRISFIQSTKVKIGDYE